MNQLTGKQFRLPTEAEWEVAAKDGDGYWLFCDFVYSGGYNIDDVAWYAGSTYDANPRTYSHVVGTKAANCTGIYDMTGNVAEWCSDWFGSYTYADQTNPT